MSCHESEGERKTIRMNVMKFEIPFLPAILLLGTDMLAKVAVQGIEQGLLSVVIELFTQRLKVSDEFFSKVRNLLGARINAKKEDALSV